MRAADEYVLSVCAANPDKLIAHYLIHSFLYYECDASIIADHTFTLLCKGIVSHWDTIEHPHKWMVHVGTLREGCYSGFYLKKYPTIVMSSAILLAQQFGAHIEYSQKASPNRSR